MKRITRRNFSVLSESRNAEMFRIRKTIIAITASMTMSRQRGLIARSSATSFRRGLGGAGVGWW